MPTPVRDRKPWQRLGVVSSTLALLAAASSGTAQAEDWEYEPGEGWHQQEWYDPSDWDYDNDDRNDYEYEFDDTDDSHYSVGNGIDYGWHRENIWNEATDSYEWRTEYGYHNEGGYEYYDYIYEDGWYDHDADYYIDYWWEEDWDYAYDDEALEDDGEGEWDWHGWDDYGEEGFWDW